ncbi:hypothetical protein PC116_g16688 [Phytophthora cactorum]|nr:hypothetical protein PC116_g16688 [Phytophthora cactorum]
MKIGILFPDLPLKTGWIFPHEGKDVPLTDYHDDLVTQPQIESLMAAMPWEILSTNSGSAISLHNDMGGRLGLFLGAYRQFETKHRMALWEGTHKFPIPRPKIAKSAWLADFNKKRGNRRSHAGADWKKILVIFILTMQMGWCDLDLLLDPFFLHDKVIWFPEDVQVKIEPGEEATSEVGSTTTQLNEARSADRRSAGRNSVDGREADPDLEEKPLYPPQVAPGTPANLDASRYPLTKEGEVKAKRYAFADSPIKPTSYLKSSPLNVKTDMKNDTTKTTRKKMKAPGS